MVVELLMGRTLKVPRIGIGGRNTDKPTWALGHTELADGSQDAIVYYGSLRRRRGVKKYISDPSPGDIIHKSIAHYKSNLTGITHDILHYSSNGSETVPSFNSRQNDDNIFSGTFTPWTFFPFFRGGDVYLPRAVNKDQLIFCCQNGLSPTLLFSGADVKNWSNWSFQPSTFVSVAGQSIMTIGSPQVVEKGAYTNTFLTGGAVSNPAMHSRITNINSTTSITVEDVKATTANAFVENFAAFGMMYSCIGVYNKGTVSVTSSNATGVGTNWNSLFDDISGLSTIYGMILLGNKPYRHAATFMAGPPTDTTLNVRTPDITNSAYIITRVPSFKDVCIHNESIYGVGIKEFPSRVYVGPPGWNMLHPPGATLPFDFSIEFQSYNTQDFLLDYIDVPNPNDSEPIVAILATDGPRLVLKEKKVYGVYGDPPSLSQRLIHAGDGCIDIRSAISTAQGAFWAGRKGIWRYRYGQFKDITDGWMQSEWRSLVERGVYYATSSVDGKYYIMSIQTADIGPTVFPNSFTTRNRRTFVYDLEQEIWLPELTNVYIKHSCNTTRYGANLVYIEDTDLYGDFGVAGEVYNLSPALNNTGPSRDEFGTGPNLSIVTGDNLSGDPDQESRVIDVNIHANISDPGGTTTLNVKSFQGGALRGDGSKTYDNMTYDDGTYYGPDGGKTLGTITGDNDDTIERHPFEMNRQCRRLGLIIEEATTSSTVSDVEFGELVVNMRDTRKGT
jgi:hypothetical protein